MSTSNEDRVRLRLSLNPSLYESLVETSEVLGLDKTALATFAFSLGLRALRMIAQPGDVPARIKNQMGLDQLAEEQGELALADAGLPSRRL